jgi:hypothetical protein
MEETLIRSVQLDNGLELEIFDTSKQIAADRFVVRCVARIPVPAERFTPMEIGGFRVSVEEIRSVLGDPVVFEQRRERNFVDAKEKDQLLFDLVQFLITNLKDYLSRPDFPSSFLKKRYQDHLRQQPQMLTMPRNIT